MEKEKGRFLRHVVRSNQRPCLKPLILIMGFLHPTPYPLHPLHYAPPSDRYFLHPQISLLSTPSPATMSVGCQGRS
ncbi:MAG: hypothetical protein HWQ40_33185 [Nostoc sp. NMS9]|nr:hypothetical protein [Nostoc sp. NMS9]